MKEHILARDRSPHGRLASRADARSNHLSHGAAVRIH
jgi:hypothetical protein